MSESELIIKEAYQYLKRIPSLVTMEGVDDLLKKIEATHSAEQQRDYLASFILATLWVPYAKRLVFEEPCDRHASKGPHDIVIYLNDDNDTRIVNEIKRLKPTLWDQKEEKEYVCNSLNRTGRLYQLREDPNRSSTGFLDTIFKEVESKGSQLDANCMNIVWFSSRALHYEADDIEGAAWHYAVGQKKLPLDQHGKSHKKPVQLTALGWFFDGNPQCAPDPECFFLELSVVAKVIGKTIKTKFIL